MRTTTVADVMTRDVITVKPNTPYKDVVDLLVRMGISAVPVTDQDGAILGVVSEADLLHKQEHEDDDYTDGPPLFAGHRTREQWRKAVGLTSAEVMTTPALTVTSEAFLPAVARKLAHTGVHRLFVVDGGHLVGVVARRDLLRTFLRADTDIRAAVERAISAFPDQADTTLVRVTVADGVVTLTGRVERPTDIEAAIRRCESIPGVVAVRNRLVSVQNGPNQT